MKSLRLTLEASAQSLERRSAWRLGTVIFDSVEGSLTLRSQDRGQSENLIAVQRSRGAGLPIVGQQGLHALSWIALSALAVYPMDFAGRVRGGQSHPGGSRAFRAALRPPTASEDRYIRRLL